MKIAADDALLQYSGRIDFEDPAAPVFVYAGSWVKMAFTGNCVSVLLENRHSYFRNDMGYFLDGVQGRFRLHDDGELHAYEIGSNLSGRKHELLLFKRMDACHHAVFRGFDLEGNGAVLPLPPKPERRLEVFGDSVSCGEVSEAVEYAGKSDPEGHDGVYSNSWYSYSWMAARKLNAELHITAQGGAALMDGTGWFHGPTYLGMESIYDKTEYNPDIGAVKQWDFKAWQPHVAVVAIGQNDSNPEDYMASDDTSEKAERWRRRYQGFVERLMEVYPEAHLILTTTILGHDRAWDRAIEEVCDRIHSGRVHHFLYEKNGCGTPGHIRIPEAEKMAEELADFVETLGDVWGNASQPRKEACESET